MPRLRSLRVALVLGLGLAAVLPLWAPTVSTSFAAPPAGYTFEDVWYPTHDGVSLHAGVYLPGDHVEGEQHPVILSITPYTSPNGGATGAGQLDSEQPVRFPELFDHPAFIEGRYAYVAVDVRGFGGSGGCFQYYGINEFLDTKATIDWAGTADWSTGKVALWGKSYDAAEEVLALGSGSDHLAAAVIQAPGLSGYTALWQNGVHYATGRYATTSVYYADDLFPPTSAGSVDDPNYWLSIADGQEGRGDCTVDWQGMNLIGDRGDPFWEGKEPYYEALGSDVPTLWHNGFFDANTKPVGLDIWSSLTGPKQAWWGQWDHVRGHEAAVGREGFLDESFRFMDQYVRGITPAVVDPIITVQSGGPDGEWRREEQWPPADAAVWTMDLNTGAYDDLPEDVTGGPEDGVGIWSMTPALPHDVHLAGEAILQVQANTTVPGTHLVVRMYDLDDTGAGVMVSRSAHALDGPGEASASVPLYPQDWRFQEGHRIAIYVAASEDGWYSPGTTGTTVEVTGAQLDLPLLAFARGDDTWLEGGASNFSSAFPITLDPSDMAAAEVPGAVPPAMGAAPTEPAPAPSSSPTSAPAPQPAPTNLPATGGGMTALATLATAAAASLRRR